MNNLFIVSGPSCAGEDTIIKEVAQKIDIERVITTTTRPMREYEKEGDPYYFISKEEFKKRIANDEFIEYALAYNDNYYGTAKQEIERVQQSNKTGIWKIEYKGVKIIKEKIPTIQAILINAPLEQIERRLRGRESSTEEYIKERMAYTKEWMQNKDIYNYEVMNYDGGLDKAVKQMLQITQNSSLKNSY